MLDQFDDGGAGFFDTAADAETLYTRPQDPTDNATPSGLSADGARAGAAGRADRARPEYAERADRAAASAGGLAERGAPVRRLAAGGRDQPAAWAYRRCRSPIVGIRPTTRAPSWSAIAYRQAPAGSVIMVGEPDQPGFALLADRPLRDGRATAYVCRGFVCRLPVTSAGA